MKSILSVLLAIFSSSVFALEAPWHFAEEPSSPWGSAERRNSRENFFASLGFGKERTSTEVPEKIRAEIADASPNDPWKEESAAEAEDDLSSIPWAAHRTLYPTQKFSSNLLWPVEGGRMSSGYGLRNGKTHEGLDIAAPDGTPIRAAADGRVVFAGRLSGYGEITVIYHGSGYSSIYAHNAQNLRARGAVVKKGELIARVGHSGRAQGSHCHFEIRSDGSPVNPLRFSFAKNPLLAKR